MEKSKITLTKPELRKELPADVVEYLEETYPPRINGAGIKQKDSVNYITEELDFLENDSVNKCLEDKNGLKALGLLWFLRLIMAISLGWGLDMTGRKQKMIFSQLKILCNIEEKEKSKEDEKEKSKEDEKDEIEELTDLLIDSGIVKVINCSDGKTYWTTLQQLYNYEYKSWTRIKNNEAKRKYDQKKKNKENNNDTNVQTEEHQPPIEFRPDDFMEINDNCNNVFEEFCEPNREDGIIENPFI